MAAAHPRLTPPSSPGLEAFLARWRETLERWLAAGTAVPSDAARCALARLLAEEATAAWPEVRRLGEGLASAEGKEAAAALLDLLVWLETAERLSDAERIAVAGSAQGRDDPRGDTL